DYLVEEELRLCLKAEERMHLEHEKNIREEQRFRVNEAKRMKLEEEKILEISELKKRRQEFMNSTHVKSILGKLTHTKGNHVDSMPGKTKATLFEIDNERDFRAVRDTYASCQVLNLRCQERREQTIEMQPFLHLSIVLAESYNLLKELQDYELEKCRDLMKSISETQLKVLKKISFMAKLRCQ
ncbi:hypothetical protein Tco_1087124, partial [Tanacetum coccineum]